jgi:hypothetical protein
MVNVLAAITFLLLFVATKGDDYIPCKSYISFSYDDSNSLSSEQFTVQMNFIINAVYYLNYPARLRAEGAFTDAFNWNSGLSVNAMAYNLQYTQQTFNSYSLAREAASLLTSIENVYNNGQIPTGAIIFISDTSDYALRGASRYFSQLNDTDITFIILGQNASASKLEQFSSNFIFWTDLTQSQPDNWDSLSYYAYGCNSSSPATGGTVTPYPTRYQTTTYYNPWQTFRTTYYPWQTTETPYIPCKSWISFGFDDSNGLDFFGFTMQKSFIISALGALNYPNRLQIIGSYISGITWNTAYDIRSMQSYVRRLEQTGPYSLARQLAALLTSLDLVQRNGMPVGALIFISDTSDSALSGALPFLGELQNVRLTFVLMGPNVTKSKLTQFSNNFITWSNLSQSQPDNWNSLSSSAFGC